MPATFAVGQHGPVTVDDVVITVHLDVEADMSAFLLNKRGRVRSDGDFVFYNQPSGPGVWVRPGPAGESGSLAITLSRIPTDIVQVRVVVSLDNPSDSFDEVGAPTLTVTDMSGTTLYDFTIDGLGGESTAIGLEFYRRGSDWELRAVGAGYRDGFERLVAHHGVTVMDSDAVIPPPVLNRPLTPSHAVDLVPGQAVPLHQVEGGGALTYVRMGLGWDPIRELGRFGWRDATVDLDASALIFARDRLIDAVYHQQLISKDGSIRHQGDSVTGEGKGDNEMITVDLTRVDAAVTSIIFVVTSYQGQTFEQIQNAYCRLIDGTTDTELARYDLLGGRTHTGMVMAQVQRSHGSWQFHAIGQPIQAKHPLDAVPQLSQYLR